MGIGVGLMRSGERQCVKLSVTQTTRLMLSMFDFRGKRIADRIIYSVDRGEKIT
jgi:hypothetical protein